MRKIHPSMIQTMFSPAVFQRGITYYEQKRVTDLEFDKAHHVWTGRVHGRQSYFVEVDFKAVDQRKLITYCDCPAFKTYDTCKHVAAMLLSINDAVDSFTDEPDYSLTEQLINGLMVMNDAAQLTVLSEKMPMNVQYVCFLDDYDTLKIEIKTGIDHCYVVRDVETLLTNIFAHDDHYFTKKFSYDPSQHYYLEKDLHIFKMLHSLLMNEEIYDIDYDFNFRYASKKRYVTIPPLFAKELLNKLIERDLTVVIGEKEYRQINVIDDQLPVTFSVENKQANELTLKVDGLTEATYLPMYRAIFLNGNFYFLNDEQLQIVEQLFNIGLTNNELPIAKGQLDPFFSEALPLLKRTSEVNIDEQITEKIVERPLQATLHLDVHDHLLVGQLNYTYGPYEIDPFSGVKSEDIVIIRDIHQEREIMNLIEQAQFRYNGKSLYLDRTEDEVIYRFLYVITPLLKEKVNLQLTNDVRQMMNKSELAPEINVNVDHRTNLLEVGFSIDGVSDEEVNEILQAVTEKKRFYRLQSGALISLEDDNFSTVNQLFTELALSSEQLAENKVTLPAYRTNQVDELIDVKKHYHPSFKKLLTELNSPERLTYPIPETLQAQLRDYQKTGFQWFKTLSTYHLGGILADDMGLGKTIQTITYILSESTDNPHLIVVPASVVYNWRNEFRKFAPHVTVDVIAGTPEERLNIINDEQKADVWITSYGTIRQDIKHYQDCTFQTLILDEAQYIKNYATKTSQAVRQINSSKRFALSGTPIENSLDELWAIFQVVLPGLMPSQRIFRQLDSKKIMSLTRPFILRRLKEDVLSELPEKIESVHMSQLTEEQKALYVGYLRKIQTETVESIASSGFQANRMKILAGLTRLRQICCHPSLFIENYDGQSGKLEELIEMVQTLKQNGQRMLIFSQFTSMHDIIKERLEQIGINYFYLHGETKAEERVNMSEQFNNGEKDLFLISLRAGGTGLNLTGADTVILFDLWWNPAVEDQAAGRAHRFGQKNVVQVIRFITEGTIEEKIYELQQKKRELIDEVIETGDSSLSRLTEDDIRQLLNL